MIIIAAVDNNFGSLFYGKRTTKDREVQKRILTLRDNELLYMNQYTAEQFKDMDLLSNIVIMDTFLQEAKKGEYCFVEDMQLKPYIHNIEKIILFKWNRCYPSTFKLDFIPEKNGWTCTKTEDFKGYSHDKITMEYWIPREETHREKEN